MNLICLLSAVSSGVVHGCGLLHVQLSPRGRISFWFCKKSHPEVCSAPGTLTHWLNKAETSTIIRKITVISRNIYWTCFFLFFFFQQVFAETKDELSLVLFGTDSTKNPLSQDGQYQNITVHCPFMVPDFTLLEEIEHQLQPENQQGDCILYVQYVFILKVHSYLWSDLLKQNTVQKESLVTPHYYIWLQTKFIFTELMLFKKFLDSVFIFMVFIQSM